MGRDEARAFITTLNTVQPFIPPMFFQSLVNSPVVRLAEQVGNGQAEVSVEPPKPASSE